MQKIIIGLVGPIASGKDVAKKYLIEKYGAEAVKFSTPLRDVLNRMAVSVSRENLQSVSTLLRGAFGEDLLAKTIAKDASELRSDIVIVDGVRRMADIVHLKKLDNFVLVKIEADPVLRYERMKNRNENAGDAEKTFDEFMVDHEREAEKEIPKVMSEAKWSIDNNGDFEKLYKQIDILIETFNKEN